MKKAICLIICIAIALTLCGCRYNKTENDREGNDNRMTIIYNDGFVLIHRDNKTGVQYFSRPGAGTCVMLNADGTPYTGEG